MATVEMDEQHARILGFRRVAIFGIVISLSLTALVGIIALLAGDFGELQSRILVTTLLVAAFSITALCHLAIVGRALRIVGYLGIAMSTLALVAGIVLIWSTGGFDAGWDAWWKAFGVLSVLAVSLAHANLLLVLAERTQTVLRILLIGTVVAIAVVALLIIIPIVTDGDIPGPSGDAYWRFVGVAAILDVLGTITLPVTNRFLGGDNRTAGSGDPRELTTVWLDLPVELIARLDSAAAAAGVSREAVVVAALEDRWAVRSESVRSESVRGEGARE